MSGVSCVRIAAHTLIRAERTNVKRFVIHIHQRKPACRVHVRQRQRDITRTGAKFHDVVAIPGKGAIHARRMAPPVGAEKSKVVKVPQMSV